MPAPPPDPAPADACSPADTPTWDGLYDADRARKLIANLRAEVTRLKAARAVAPDATALRHAGRVLAELRDDFDIFRADLNEIRDGLAVLRSLLARAEAPSV